MTEISAWQDLSFELHGVPVAHRMRDGRMPLLMVHGIGPGTTGEANFGPLIAQLSGAYALHVIDLAGFGASGRLPTAPFFNVAFWLTQINVMIERVRDLHGRMPILIGNSVGGALALRIATQRHDLPAVIAIGAPAQPVVTEELAAFWSVPSDTATLAAAMQPMTGAALPPDPALVASRISVFSDPSYGPYFGAMLADPLACLSALMPEAGSLERISIPTTVIHGRLDRACPVSGTLGLLPQMPDANFVLLGGCGHNVISERPAEVFSILERIAHKVAKP